MTTYKFKPGDVVEVKSGGPTMTVKAVVKDGFSGNSVECMWYDYHGEPGYHTESFPASCLRKPRRERLLDRNMAQDATKAIRKRF